MRNPLYTAYERRLVGQLDPASVPRHVGMIVDGNRRFAKARGANADDGHRAGAANVGSFLEPGIFLQPRALAQIALFTALAVASKFLGAYFGARAEGKQIAAEVGVAMVPRGEVGIVVASIALSAGAIDNDLYGVVVAVVILTTVAAPFLIRWIYERTPVNEHPGSRGVATENSVEG